MVRVVVKEKVVAEKSCSGEDMVGKKKAGKE